MNGLAHRFASRPNSNAAGRSHPISVAACIVRDAEGRVLLARRRPDQISPGFWEIPGGKIEPGETAHDAAVRELYEETGVAASGLKPVTRYCHRFPTRSIDLTLFEAAEWSGTPHGRENQMVDWVMPGAPHVGPLLQSNKKILRLLSLPETVLFAEPPLTDVAAWAADTAERAHALRAGAVMLAGRRLPVAQQIVLAGRLRPVLRRYGISLWMDCPASAAARIGAELAIPTRGEGQPRGSDMIYATVDPDEREARTADVILTHADSAGLNSDFDTAAPVYTFMKPGPESVARTAEGHRVILCASVA
jgi:8-oxo-dGTP diphosphatase